jgi:hypothetical protein
MVDDTDDVAAQLLQALASAARCASEETTQNYDALSQDLADLEVVAKASAAAHADCRAVLANLHAGAALSDDDIAALRLLVVGDADYYLKYDEELGRCKPEVTRIIGKMQQLQLGDMSADALMHLGVLSREARALLQLIRHYFDSRDRVQRFETAIAGPIDQSTAHMLMQIITDLTA